MEEDLYTITGGPLKPHEYVNVKREMSAADDAWITNHSATIGGTKKNPKMEMTIGTVKLATLKRMIVNWSLTRTVRGHDGSETQVSIPLNEEEVERLPRRISAYINKVIDELNPDEEDEEDFTNAANGHSGGSLQMTRNLSLRD